MMTRIERTKLGRVQDLVGKAKGVYLDDRNPNTADVIIPVLEEAFNLCVQILSKYPPQT